METTVRERLLESALAVLGTRGAVGFSARAAETAAAVPHGSVRHHFGGLDGLVEAMVGHLLAADLAAGTALVASGAPELPVDPVRTAARYELMLMSLRSPALAARFLAARDEFIAHVAAVLDVPDDRAHAVLAGADGVILDALLRGHASVPLPTAPPTAPGPG